MSNQTKNTMKDDKQDIYRVYKAIYNTKLAQWRKNSLLTNLMGGYDSSWKVIGVTEKAVEALTSFERKETTKRGVTRAHIVQRNLVAKKVFGKRLKRDKFFKVFNRDYTILVGPGENKTDLEQTLLVYEIPLDRKLFPCARIGFSYGERESSWLKNREGDPKELAKLFTRLKITVPTNTKPPLSKANK